MRKRVLQRVVNLRDEEVGAALWSAAFFFFVLASYSILRPIRDAIGVQRGVQDLPNLALWTLGAMVVANPLYGALVARFPRRRFIPYAYHFFALNLVAFYALLTLYPAGSRAALVAGRVYFVWVTVYNLFITTVFWSFMADLFTTEQGKRLFGFIGVGGTLGALVGALVTASLAEHVGAFNLLLVSAVLLEAAVVCCGRLSRLFGLNAAATPDVGDAPPPRGRAAPPRAGSTMRSLYEGALRVVESPYLLAIVGYIFLFTITSTFLYFEYAGAAKASFPDTNARASFFGYADAAVNTATVVVQIFFTGRILTGLGVRFALLALPALTLVGFGAVAGVGAAVHGHESAAALLWTVTVFNVSRRALNFALARPAREVLYTVVPRADKYKAKAVIDTFIYRAGDAVAAVAFGALLAPPFNITLTGGALVALGVTVAWTIVTVYLARRHERLVAAASTRCPACGAPVVPGRAHACEPAAVGETVAV